MNTSDIYFERHVEYDSKKLIHLSELRRKVVQSVNHSKNGYSSCLEYINLLDEIMKHDTKLTNNILFIWNGHNSSCWKFEKIHILQLLSHWAHDIAVNNPPKEAKEWFSKSVSHEIESIKTLNTYSWRDSTVAQLPIMQDRYHLAKVLIYASDYFFNMYTFKEILLPHKRSYQLIELANRLWKRLDYDQLNVRHALTLKHVAEELDDDKCGERVALMEQALQLHENTALREAHNLWKQQNDGV